MHTSILRFDYRRFDLDAFDFGTRYHINLRLVLAACLIALAASPWPAFGQSGPTGEGGSSSYLYSWMPSPSSNPAPVEYGYVEQADGHLHLEIPIGEPRHNRIGDGTKQVRLVYDSNFWSPAIPGGMNYYWFPGTSWHLLPELPYWDAYSPDGKGDEYIGVTDADGGSHRFTCRPGCYSVEGQGYWVGDAGVYDPSGALIVNESDNSIWDSRVVDSNGNYFQLAGGTLPSIYGEATGTEYFDTSNIPFFYYYTSPFLGQEFTDPGPYQDYYYYAPNMNSSGSNAEYLVHEVQIQLSTAFNEQRVWVGECPTTSGQGDTSCLAQVLSQIVLPDNTSFTFKYDCDSTIAVQQTYCSSPGGQPAYYGGLTQMTTPVGGVYTYSYAPFFDAYQDASLGLISRSNGQGTWRYSQSAVGPTCGPTDVGCELSVTTVEPNGRTTVVTSAIYTSTVSPYPISELVTDGSGHNLFLTQTQWDTSHGDGQIHYGAKWVHKQWETITEWDSTGAVQTKKTAYTYDSPQTGNVTVLQEWGYYPGTSPSFPSIADRTTYTSYYTPTSSPIMDSSMIESAGGTNVIDKPTSITVCNNVGSDSACLGGGTRVSQKLITYDQYGSSGPTSVTGVANHDDQAYGNTQLVRGNPTSISQWVSNGQYVPQYMTYDTTGQVTSSTDGNGYLTQYNYSDNYYVDNATSSPAAYTPPLPAPTHAHATTITLPTVNGQSFTKKTGYYYGNQKPAYTTDVNSKSTYYHYSDPLDRVTQVVYPLGWALTQYTAPTQIDVYRSLSSPTPSSACAGTGCLHTSTMLDGLGRVIHTVRPDGSTVDTTYNSMGLVASVSNPHVTAVNPSDGITSYIYDILDRLCMQSNPGNTPTPTTCTTKGSSALEYSYIVNGGYKTDENGNTWEYLYDPLARLASVIEPNGALTQYTYDALGDLLNASQSSTRLRTFTYDGLSRLVTSSNPESGTVCYGTLSGSNCTSGYDGNSNLIAKTDARGVVVRYTYDTWNRVTSKSYSDGITPGSCYQYDASGITNAISRLANAWTQPNGTTCTGSQQTGFAPVAGQYLTRRAILAYDLMGRITSEQQSTPASLAAGTIYAPQYQYDLAGNLIASTDGKTTVPSAAVSWPSSCANGVSPQQTWSTLSFVNCYDAYGRLQSVTSNWNDMSTGGTRTHPANLFSNPSYSPPGGLTGANYGNGALSLTRSYNNRLRTTGELDQGLTASPGTAGSAVVTVTGAERSQ